MDVRGQQDDRVVWAGHDHGRDRGTVRSVLGSDSDATNPTDATDSADGTHAADSTDSTDPTDSGR